MATEIRDELDRDSGTSYKIITGLEKKQLVKIGYKRSGRIQGVAFCYLPEQEEAVKAGKYGMVYLPIEKVVKAKPQADKETVLGYIKKIDRAISSENWNSCNSWVIELRQLCINRRTGHINELLDAIDRYVGTQELFENEETREELATMMTYILENEKKVGNIENANKVTEQLLEPIRKIALYDRKNGLVYSLRFLGMTKVKKSVDVIADLISKSPLEIAGNLEGEIRFVLFGSELAKEQKEYVRGKLVELSSSENTPIRSVAMRLQEKPRLF